MKPESYTTASAPTILPVVVQGQYAYIHRCGANTRILRIGEIIDDCLGDYRRAIIQQVRQRGSYRQPLAGDVINSNASEVFAISEPFDDALEVAC